MKKKRYFELDFIRFIATISIVIFHFYINGKQIYNPQYLFTNYDLGSFGVSLFLILSGASLVISEKDNFSIFNFYKKRIKAIYPLFIIGTIIFFVINFLTNYHSFDVVKTVNWIPTLLGFGGFLSYKYPTFNQVGEWYIGCILILYLLYPILRLIINKKPILSFIVIMVMYILLNFYYSFKMPAIWCPFLRIMEFVLGIYFSKYIIKNNFLKDKKNNLILMVISFILFIIIAYIPNNLFVMFNILIGGICSFTFLFCLGKYIKSVKVINSIKLISKYSYSIFLVHHQIVWLLNNNFTNQILLIRDYYFIFIIYLILTFISAYILCYITDKLVDFYKQNIA